MIIVNLWGSLIIGGINGGLEGSMAIALIAAVEIFPFRHLF